MIYPRSHPSLCTLIFLLAPAIGLAEQEETKKEAEGPRVAETPGTKKQEALSNKAATNHSDKDEEAAASDKGSSNEPAKKESAPDESSSNEPAKGESDRPQNQANNEPSGAGIKETAEVTSDRAEPNQKPSTPLERTPGQTENLESADLTQDAPSPSPFSRRTDGLRIQAISSFAQGQAYDPAIGILFNARFESDSHFVQVAMGVMVPSMIWSDNSLNIKRYGGALVELSANYYLTRGSYALYTGGGMSPRLVGGDQLDLAFRLTIFGQIGLAFWRKANTSMFSEIRAGQNILPFQSFDFEKGEGDEYYPTEITLALGVGW